MSEAALVQEQAPATAEKLISVSEVFGPVLQGEGPVLGEPTVFVRTGGCDYRCSWCDSLHAVMPEHSKEWEALTVGQVFVRIRRHAPFPIMVTLSGGNPAMQPLEPLIRFGHNLGYTFCIETQGSIAPDWLRMVDVVVLSPKPPSSGMAMHWDRFHRCVEAAEPEEANAEAATGRPRQVVLKVPVFDDRDLDWVESRVMEECPDLPLYLSVGNPNPPGDPAARPDMNLMWDRSEHSADWMAGNLLARYEWLTGEVLRRGMRCRVTPQMHVLVHGNRRGV